jgi:hypothetical protein
MIGLIHIDEWLKKTVSTHQLLGCAPRVVAANIYIYIVANRSSADDCINHNKTTVDLSSTTMYNRSADDNVIIAIPGCGQLLAAGGTPEQSKKMNYAQELHYTILAIAML